MIGEGNVIKWSSDSDSGSGSGLKLDFLRMVNGNRKRTLMCKYTRNWEIWSIIILASISTVKWSHASIAVSGPLQRSDNMSKDFQIHPHIQLYMLVLFLVGQMKYWIEYMRILVEKGAQEKMVLSPWLPQSVWPTNSSFKISTLNYWFPFFIIHNHMPHLGEHYTAPSILISWHSILFACNSSNEELYCSSCTLTAKSTYIIFYFLFLNKGYAWLSSRRVRTIICHFQWFNSRQHNEIVWWRHFPE